MALQQLAPYFAAEPGENIGEHLRVVFLAGDWIPLRLPDEVRAAFPNAQVVNLGGATPGASTQTFFWSERSNRTGPASLMVNPYRTRAITFLMHVSILFRSAYPVISTLAANASL